MNSSGDHQYMYHTVKGYHHTNCGHESTWLSRKRTDEMYLVDFVLNAHKFSLHSHFSRAHCFILYTFGFPGTANFYHTSSANASQRYRVSPWSSCCKCPLRRCIFASFEAFLRGEQFIYKFSSSFYYQTLIVEPCTLQIYIKQAMIISKPYTKFAVH